MSFVTKLYVYVSYFLEMYVSFYPSLIFPSEEKVLQMGGRKKKVAVPRSIALVESLDAERD